MKDGSERPGNGCKKPYKKPEVKQVQLRPEEAVLGGCKVGTSSGPVVTCFNATACAVLAS